MPANCLSLVIAHEVVQRLHAAGSSGYPEEVCGLLLGKFEPGRVVTATQAVIVPNAAREEVGRRYTISPRLLLEWERIGQRSGLSIVGFFHSHPDAPPTPSATDTALAWPGYAYVIISVSGTTVDVPAGARREAKRDSSARPIITGMAAWTFEESSASFVEVPVTVDVAADEIEYFI